MIDLKTDIEEEVMEDGKRQQSRTSGFLKFLVNFSFTCRLVHFQGKTRRKIELNLALFLKCYFLFLPVHFTYSL